MSASDGTSPGHTSYPAWVSPAARCRLTIAKLDRPVVGPFSRSVLRGAIAHPGDETVELPQPRAQLEGVGVGGIDEGRQVVEIRLVVGGTRKPMRGARGADQRDEGFALRHRAHAKHR